MSNSPYVIIFPSDYAGQYEEECVYKGRLAGTVVGLGGKEYSVTFVAMARLSQMLEDQIEAGYSHYSEPGLIVLDEVTRASIEAAVRALFDEHFFNMLESHSDDSDGA